MFSSKKSSLYKRVELLGEGASGCVYKVIKKEPQTQVTHTAALKVLNSETILSVWKKEFESLSRVQSPYCITLLGWQWEGKKPGLLLEYVEGASLKELYLYTELTSEEILEISWQIHEGLKHLSKKNLFHGDLNLSNVLIDIYGQVKLIDFGLACYTDDGLMTTPEYTAPEVFKTHKVNYKSDLYSLGCLIKHLRQSNDSQKLLKKEEILMSSSPENRSWDPVELDHEELRTSLGSRVMKVIYKKKSLKEKTKALFRHSKRKMALLQIAVLSAFAATVLLSRSVQEGHIDKSFISIKTHKWVEVIVNGEKLGYSPIEDFLVNSGKVQIQWKALKRKGKKVFNILPREHVILDDTFFFGEEK